MITVFADIRSLDVQRLEAEYRESTVLSDVVVRGKSDTTFYERVATYTLLKLAYEKIFNSMMPNIEKDVNGKPRFKRTESSKLSPLPSFNISHACGLSVVSFYTGDAPRKVGVDVEKYNNEVKSEKIEEKLSKYVNNSLHILPLSDAKIYYATLSGDLLSFDRWNLIFDSDLKEDGMVNNENVYVSRTERPTFFNKWTSLEAILKADGGGFSSIKKVEESLNITEGITLDLFFKDEKYSLSMALI